MLCYVAAVKEIADSPHQIRFLLKKWLTDSCKVKESGSLCIVWNKNSPYYKLALKVSTFLLKALPQIASKEKEEF